MDMLTTSIWMIALILTIGWYIAQINIGKLITLQSFVVLQFFLLPILIQFPYATLPGNIVTIGEAGYQLTLRGFNAAFLITIWGMIWFSLPFIIRLRIKGVWQIADLTVDTFCTAASLKILLFLLIICLVAVYALFMADPGASFYTGGLRGATIMHHSLNPLLMVVVAFVPIIAALSLYRSVLNKPRSVYAMIFLIASIVGLLTGTRTTALLGLFMVIVAFIMARSHAGGYRHPWYTLLKLTIPSLLFLIAIFSIAGLRDGKSLAESINDVFGDGINSLYFHIFFGNTFSDLRDFSRILGGWNGKYLYGETLLSGVLSFLPHAILPEKIEWTWGAVTSPMAGIHAPNFPGLRPTIFGEWYLNFGLPGVAFEAFMLGAFVRSLDGYLKHAALAMQSYSSPAQWNSYIFKTLTTIILVELSINFCLSAGAIQVYLIVGLMIALRLLRRDRKGQQSFFPDRKTSMHGQ